MRVLQLPFFGSCPSSELKPKVFLPCERMSEFHECLCRGSVVYYSQALTLESVLMRDSFVHVSNRELATLPRDMETKSRLPKLLRTGRSFEINVSSETTQFTIHQV